MPVVTAELLALKPATGSFISRLVLHFIQYASINPPAPSTRLFPDNSTCKKLSQVIEYLTSFTVKTRNIANNTNPPRKDTGWTFYSSFSFFCKCQFSCNGKTLPPFKTACFIYRKFSC